MKNKFKIYFYILIFLFGVFNYAQASLMVSCQSTPNPANVNQTVNFASFVSGGIGNYTYDWYGACLGSSTNCSRSFSSEGNYTAYLDVTSGQEFQTASCPVTVVSPQPCTSHNYKACSGGNAYWYDSCGNKEELFQDCGSGTCSNGQCQQPACRPNSYKNCYNNDVWWYDSCGTRQNIYQNCSSDQTCQNGQCVSNCTSNNYKACYNNDVYWFDSCGTRQDLYQDCSSGTCSNGQCVGSNLNVSCSANPNPANINQTVNFISNIYGGTGYYSYSWSGACTGSSSTCSRYFSYPGNQLAYLNIYSDGQSASTNCSVNIQGTSQECTSGPCCQNGRLRPSYETCNYDMQTEYSCAWGTGCSSDVAKKARVRYQYCSGTNPQCTGRWGDWSSWTGWETADYCTAKERCVEGYSQCQASSSCGVTYTKKCYGNSLYWYDNYGARQSLYRNCSDDNQCTIDSCSSNKCVNELKCDGSTCEKSSQDYCDSCQHVGDGTCNCGETSSSSTDCITQAISCPSAGGMLVSILAKKGKETTQWDKELTIAPKDTFDFLVIVANQSETPISNVALKVALPVEINFAGNLKIDGSSVSDSDIEAGINLGTIASKTIKTITFSTKAVSEGETSVGAVASAANLSVSDYLKIDVSKSGTELATVGSAFSNFLKNNYVLFIFLLIGVIVIALILRTAFTSLRGTQ